MEGKGCHAHSRLLSPAHERRRRLRQHAMDLSGACDAKGIQYTKLVV